MTVFDKNLGKQRPTSQNFNDSSDGTPMSVYAENLAIEAGEQPADFLKGRWQRWYLAAVTAGRMRVLNQQVYPDLKNQEPDDFHKSHAVEGHKNSKTRTKIGEDFEWIKPPADLNQPASE